MVSFSRPARRDDAAVTTALRTRPPIVLPISTATHQHNPEAFAPPKRANGPKDGPATSHRKGRHGRPFDLILTGPLAAHYARPGEDPRLRVDAVKLSWILSGREQPDLELPGEELLTTRLLF